MLKSSVSSYVFKIHPVRNAKDCVTLSDRFDGNIDIMDVILKNLQNGSAFKLSDVRFGEGTAADSGADEDSTSTDQSQTEALSEENFGKTTSGSTATIALEKIIKCGVERDRNGTKLYKYIFFSVEYGENGDRAVLKRPHDEPIEIHPEHFYSRVYHVFLAYIDDDDKPRGIAYFEARGGHSINTPLQKVMSCAIRKIDGRRYKLEINSFSDADAVEKLIKEAEVKEITLIKNRTPSEANASMEYEKQQLIFLKPKSRSLKEMVMSVIRRGKSELDRYNDNEFSELKNFNPDQIKFKLGTKNGKERIFIAGNPSSRVVQELLPDDVVMADGCTNSTAFFDEIKEIIAIQHFCNTSY